MPVLATNIGYGYSQSESTPSVVISNSNIGFTGGLTMAWNLFDGKKKKMALQNAQIAIESNELYKQQALLTIDKELANYYGLYKNNLALLELETQNLEAAKLNLQRSKELFKQGQINNVQFRQAQLNVLNSETKLNNAKYSAKITEYQIKRLGGELIISHNT